MWDHQVVLCLAGHSTGAISWTEYQTALTGKSYNVQTDTECEKPLLFCMRHLLNASHSPSLLLLCISLFGLFCHRFIFMRGTSKNKVT